ncbi:MAG: energy transducer TonB [Winogradskyella sp.]|uniref:energy transducer TonB family protein n=1 Tax=Winogradskyella sp. TaxID=1883156 RepID=UPI0018564451|nr:energy transducer TonB [Winogradskyella sp.]
MNFLDQYKASIITFLVAGIIILGLFSFQLKQQGKLITESYYEIEPEPEKTEQERIEALEQLEALQGASTNKAFNEDQEFKEMMRNFKTFNANEPDREPESSNESEPTDDLVEESSLNQSYGNNKAYALKTKETESYKKLQENLKKRLENKQQADEHAKSRSTLTYSLKGRTLLNYKIPRYLCEEGGKIVVTIKVGANGLVKDANINGSSTSRDQCLIESAISYAKTVRFNNASKQEQLGTITFLFKGKN